MLAEWRAQIALSCVECADVISHAVEIMKRGYFDGVDTIHLRISLPSTSARENAEQRLGIYAEKFWSPESR